MRARRILRPDAGFTLAEILVSLGLAALLFSAVLSVAQVQASLHRDQAALQATLDNGRAALNAVAHDARLLGAPAWGYGLTNSTGAGPQPVPLYRVIDNGGADRADRLDLIIPSGDALLLDKPAGPGTGLLELRRLEALANPALGAPPNRDLRRGGLGLLSNVTLLPPPGVAPMLNPPSAGCDGGSGGLGVSLLRMLAPSGDTQYTIVPLATGGCTFGRGSLLVGATAPSYWVDAASAQLMVSEEWLLSPPASGAPIDASPVAEGIVDLQIALGIDGLNGARDGVLSDDEWVFRGGSTNTTMPFQAPTAVRITVVARTLSPGGALGLGRPAVENRPAGAPDGFRYRVLSTTVVPRNLNAAALPGGS